MGEADQDSQVPPYKKCFESWIGLLFLEITEVDINLCACMCIYMYIYKCL